MEKKLQKPTFTQIKNLENGHDGYNVYVRVVSVEHTASKNGDLSIARAVVGDETGVADAFFKGDNTKLIQKGEVIAIRNGRIRLVKNHISLEIDIFGRITSEKKDITVDPKNNISEKEITRRRAPKPRREGGERFKKEGDFHKREDRPRREGGQKVERPRRYENRQQTRRNDKFQSKDEPRQRTEWTKIGAIEPGDDSLNITAQIVSVEVVGKKARVVFGDETGIVKGFIYNDEHIKEGNTVVIFNAEAAVVKEHIEIQIPRGGKIQQSKNRKIKEVDQSVDISDKAWVESA